MKRIVLGISGASGVQLSYRLMHWLVSHAIAVDLVMTKDACLTAQFELGESIKTPQQLVEKLPKDMRSYVHIQSNRYMAASVASGTYQRDATVIVPCSMASLGAIATGLSDNLLRRAADVAIKEGRPLVLVPRESPFSVIHLENMLKLAKLGVKIVPPVPAWYLQPKSIEEVENYILAKILDVLGLQHDLITRWQG